MKNDHRSIFSNLSNGKKKPEKNIRASTGFEPVTSAIPVRCSVRTVFFFIAQLVEHRTGIAEVTGSNPIEALIFFLASSFRLLKLENILR